MPGSSLIGMMPAAVVICPLRATLMASATFSAPSVTRPRPLAPAATPTAAPASRPGMKISNAAADARRPAAAARFSAPFFPSIESRNHWFSSTSGRSVCPVCARRNGSPRYPVRPRSLGRGMKPETRAFGMSMSRRIVIGMLSVRTAAPLAVTTCCGSIVRLISLTIGTKPS